MESLTKFLFSDGGYSPHGFCIAWDETVLYTHILSDALIALSYFAIPAIILIFLRRRDDPTLYAPAMLFVAFISLCGISHLMSILTMYMPWYGLQGVIKLATGLISLITVVALWRILPEALRIPSPSTLISALETKESEIADRRRAESMLTGRNRQLDQMMQELKSTNEELREFAYAASHDLKSPANTLSLWLREFSEEFAPQLNDDAREMLVEADGIVQRMRSLVEDILSYSRVVNRKAEAPAPVDFTEVFNDAAHGLRVEIEEARAKIVIGNMPKVDAFRPLVSILAHNLLSNAVKFRNADRPVRVTVTGRIEPGPPSAFVLQVRDNGIGIDPQHYERIFRMFQRLHRPEDYDGTGLGLALCRRIAVTHGGSIRVISGEGAGAEFIVTFPLENPDAAKAA